MAVSLPPLSYALRPSRSGGDQAPEGLQLMLVHGSDHSEQTFDNQGSIMER